MLHSVSVVVYIIPVKLINCSSIQVYHTFLVSLSFLYSLDRFVILLLQINCIYTRLEVIKLQQKAINIATSTYHIAFKSQKMLKDDIQRN